KATSMKRIHSNFPAARPGRVCAKMERKQRSSASPLMPPIAGSGGESPTLWIHPMLSNNRSEFNGTVLRTGPRNEQLFYGKGR
ncbi:unnamed protein product, partial [Symbiodinium pilosum]